MNWWKVIKVALKVGMAAGKVKEAARVTEIVDAVDKVITTAQKEQGKR